MKKELKLVKNQSMQLTRRKHHQIRNSFNCGSAGLILSEHLYLICLRRTQLFTPLSKLKADQKLIWGEEHQDALEQHQLVSKISSYPSAPSRQEAVKIIFIS
jgi:hypothetical protein